MIYIFKQQKGTTNFRSKLPLRYILKTF